MTMVPSNAAQKYWALIQNYFLIPGNQKTTHSDLGVYYNSTVGKGYAANGGFVYPAVTINGPTDCPYAAQNCLSIAAATTAAPNTFCYDYQGKCNSYNNFSIFIAMFAEITAEYSCVANNMGCLSASGLVYPTLSAAQSTFYNNFLDPINQIISNTPVTQGVITPGPTVLANLNSSLSNSSSGSLYIPYGIAQLP